MNVAIVRGVLLEQENGGPIAIGNGRNNFGSGAYYPRNLKKPRWTDYRK
jgi:hypothetical protein